MTPKQPSLEYEPVRRTRESVPDRSKFPFEQQRTAATDEPVRPTAARAATVAQREKRPKIEPIPERWLHERGHSLSYAGIFLFTLFVFFRPYEFSPSLSWLSSFAFWIALATTIVYVLTQLGLENRITARPREVNLVLLLTLAAILSIPLALEPIRAWNSFIEFLKVVLIFIVMINVVRTEKRLKGLWLLVLIASVILSVGAVNDYRLGILGLQGRRIKGAIGGLFDNPNDLALHLVTMFPIALALSFASRNLMGKLLFFATTLLIVAGIFVTFSRGGFLALMAASGVLLWRLIRSSRWLIAPVAVAIVVLFMLFAPVGYKTRVSTTGDESATARYDDFKRSLYVAVRHPVLGVGVDNYILLSNLNKASHNAYTQVASEMGIAGALFYVLFIVAPFKGLRRIESESYQVRSARRFYYASIALQASLVGYMVASFFASVAYLWYIYYLVAYAVCLRRIYDTAVESAAPLNSSLPASI